MANPLPCRVCESEGVHSLSDWLITAQQEVMGFDPGYTMYVCQGCMAGLMIAWLQSQAPPAEEPETAPPEGPGVLEQIEHDEGTVTPSGNGRGRRKSGQEQDAADTVGSEEAETADVHQ